MCQSQYETGNFELKCIGGEFDGKIMNIELPQYWNEKYSEYVPKLRYVIKIPKTPKLNIDNINNFEETFEVFYYETDAIFFSENAIFYLKPSNWTAEKTIRFQFAK